MIFPASAEGHMSEFLDSFRETAKSSVLTITLQAVNAPRVLRTPRPATAAVRPATSLVIASLLASPVPVPVAAAARTATRLVHTVQSAQTHSLRKIPVRRGRTHCSQLPPERRRLRWWIRRSWWIRRWLWRRRRRPEDLLQLWWHWPHVS